MSIDFDNVGKSFGGLRVLDSFSLSLEDKSISCFLGPSGIGKTTILNIIAGLIIPDSGRLNNPYDGKISYLFQDSMLMPWMTVRQNICYLMDDSLDKAEKYCMADELIRDMELEGFHNHYPVELSGGMARRTALARALACPEPLLIMDEPFASLDSHLKTRIIDRVKDNIISQKRTAIMVTHDQNTALCIADKIYQFVKSKDGALVIKN